jgi:hypothetical protein
MVEPLTQPHPALMVDRQLAEWAVRVLPDVPMHAVLLPLDSEDAVAVSILAAGPQVTMARPINPRLDFGIQC